MHINKIPYKRETHNLSLFSYNLTILRFLVNEIFEEKIYYFDCKKPNPFIIDCGSNIGISIIYFKELYPNAKILSFEPHPINIEVLEKNISENNLSDITVIQAALSNEEKSDCKFWGDFRKGGDTLGGTIIEELSHQENLTSTSVKSVKLSDYINQKVDLLKIDIEGAEKFVIKDIEPKLHLIEELFIEVHSIHSIANDTKQIVELLEKNNFSVELLDLNFNEVNKEELEQWMMLTGIAISFIKAKKND